MDKHLVMFYDTIKNEGTMTLSTCANNEVTIRTVSPVLYEDGVLFFTNDNSRKFLQLQENPKCAFCIGKMFVEAEATFLGKTMDKKNDSLRKIYKKKFPGAFIEGDPTGGYMADFIFLTPRKVTGWVINEKEFYSFTTEF